MSLDQKQPQQHERVLLEVKTARTGEETPESMKQFLSSLINLKKQIILPMWKRGIPISFEISVIDQVVRFYISTPAQFQAFIESQLVSQYPKALVTRTKDYLPDILAQGASLALGQIKLASSYLYPIRTSTEFKDVDPMSSLLAILAKSQPGDKVSLQVVLLPVSNSWQRAGERVVNDKPKDSAGSAVPNPYTKVIAEKIALNGFKTAIRLAVAGVDYTRAYHYLYEIGNSFSSFNNPSGNSLVLKRPILWQKQRLVQAMKSRSRYFMPRQILNVDEIATIFHFPTLKLANIANISWHKTILSQPPDMLPVAEMMTEEEKNETNFFAKTEFRNKMSVFGVKQKDRRRHVYIIGKTGAGKSTLIANMAINDMRNKRGFCIIDPHGDLCETILDYVPSYRVNDIVYLDPGEQEHAFALNPLEIEHAYQKELVVSGVVSIFNKLYGTSWGPRLEYILRNTLSSVIELPNATLMMVPEMLANESFRAKAVAQLQDPVLKSFWVNEFANYTDKLRAEAVSPIQNKVGQFVSSRIIRNIIKQPKSTIDLGKIMDEGKILLLNLSQGKLGEDNAALLGAMIITKIQLAAMNRVNQKEEDRKDFYLYVDEFQNFATTSFIKILSEARKYRLNLILANQYIAQIQEDVRAAIFGNAGTMMTFLIGAADAAAMAKEFGERFKEEDLLALGNHQAIIKLAIDNITQSPFLCYTLPLPRAATQNREKVIRSSQERYTKKVKGDSEIEKET